MRHMHLSPRREHAFSLSVSRVENWRSDLRPYLQFPLVKRTDGFPVYGFPIIFFQRLSIHLAFYCLDRATYKVLE
jgi:hypothetical protein